MGLRRWAGYTHIAATCPRRAVQPQPLLDQIRAYALVFGERERRVSLYKEGCGDARAAHDVTCVSGS